MYTNHTAEMFAKQSQGNERAARRQQSGKLARTWTELLKLIHFSQSKKIKRVFSNTLCIVCGLRNINFNSDYG